MFTRCTRILLPTLLALSTGASAAVAQTPEEIKEVERLMGAPQTPTSALSYLGGQCLQQGQPAKALSYFEKMKPLYAKYGELSPQMIWLDSQIAACHLAKGEKTKAVAIAKKCLSDADKLKGDPKDQQLKMARRFATSVTAGQVPRPEKADFDLDALLEHALKDVETAKAKGAYSPEYTKSLLQLAAAYKMQGKFDKSAETYKSATTIMENMLGPYHSALAPVLKEYAQVLQLLNKTDEKRIVTARIEKIENAAKIDSWSTCMQRGMDAFRATDIQKAVDELTKANSLAKTAKQKIFTMTQLAHILILQSKLEDAEKMLNNVSTLQKRNRQEHSLDYGGTLITYGDLYLKQGKLSESADSYNQALKLMDTLKLTEKAHNSTKLMYIALAHLGLSKVATARGEAKEAAHEQELSKEAVKEHDMMAP